jgi:hypothetical protein
VTASPDTTNANYPNGVSCVSSGACRAVGGYVNVNGVERALAESWNGTAWSMTPIPNRGMASNVLNGVSCVSASFCEAVGYAVSATNVMQTLVETWNGTTWSIASSPNSGTGTNLLAGVSCVSTSFCEAVGYAVNTSNVIQTLIETWNGTSWTVVTSANTGTGTNTLAGVSCVTASNCEAVGGSTAASGVTQTLIESWNGTAWSLATSPNSGTGANLLNDVACKSAGSCVAVGYAINSGGVIQTLAETWNGTSWSLATSPNSGAGNNSLYGVSCGTPTSCKAVGYVVNASNVIQTLVESWNGASWSITSSPDAGTGANALYGVSCGAASACKAVGSFVNTSGVTQTLLESWNGTSWATNFLAGGVLGNSLVAVSCESSGSCQAVGNYVNTSGVTQTLVAAWYGGAWLIVPTPDVGTATNKLAAVSCVTDSFCKAVGSYVNSSGVTQTLIESWNGVAWTIDTSANSGTGANNLAGVSCVSNSFCEAVGSLTGTGGISQTLVETWNGTSWSIKSSPNSGTGANSFSGVSCVSTSFCEAVGSYLKFASTVRPLAESWNGTTWAVTATATNGADSNLFTAVNCVSTTLCRAVGSYLNGSKVQQALVESWTGTSFGLGHAANSGTGNNVLNAITCPSTTSCLAVGTLDTGGVTRALVEALSGTTWTLSTAPNTGSGPNVLAGTSCVAAASCVAVGNFRGSPTGVPQTLVETYG